MEEIVRTQIRMPRDLADWLKKAAKDEGRSMNAQLVALLRGSMKRAQKNARA